MTDAPEPASGGGLRAIVRGSPDGVVVVDPRGVTLFVNPAAERLLATSASELVGTEFGYPVTEGASTEIELHPTGKTAEMRVAPIRWEGRPALMTTLRDVTERKELQATLAHQAMHDALTGLPNRLLLGDRLAQALARCERSGRFVAVLFVDLDRFKAINDSAGHVAGDRVLAMVAERLAEAVRPDDSVARFGGDEFVVVCEVVGEHQAVAIAERLVAAVEAPLWLGDRELFLTASVGVALARGSDIDPEALIQSADAAMYRGKSRAGSRIEVFDARMHARAVDRLALEHDLHRAVERGQLELDWQPLVRLPDGTVVGAEALVRWRHPRRGLIEPGAFIPVAEQSGAIVAVGEWVLRAACAQLRAWLDEGAVEDGFSIFVNLSPVELEADGFDRRLAATLAAAGVTPRSVCLELTERLLAGRSAAEVLPALEHLRAAGVRLAIDDFGTGESSLSLLKQVPADMVKIDRSFVAGLNGDMRDRGIIEAVVSLGHGLGMSVISEGVETAEQRAQVSALGCDLAQGFHFARPCSAAELEALLRERSGPA